MTLIEENYEKLYAILGDDPDRYDGDSRDSLKKAKTIIVGMFKIALEEVKNIIKIITSLDPCKIILALEPTKATPTAITKGCSRAIEVTRVLEAKIGSQHDV